MNTQIFASLRVIFLTIAALVLAGCASNQPTRYVAVAGSGTNRVLVPVEVQKAKSPWSVWSSSPVSRNRVLAPADPVPSDWMPPNPVRGQSGSFTYGSRIQSSYSQGTVNSSSHYWDQNGPNTQLHQSTWKSGSYYQEPDPYGRRYDHRDFQAAPAQPLKPIQK